MRDKMNGALRELHGTKSQSRQADTGNKKNGKSGRNSLSSKIKIKSNLVYCLALWILICIIHIHQQSFI
jgi:hypothetical protein